MLVQAFSHVVTVPTDPRNQDNLPANVRINHFVFTVALNKSGSPAVYNALASGEMLPKVELKWYRTSVEGKQEHFFTTTLTDATIVNIDCQMPHCQDPAKSRLHATYRSLPLTAKLTGEHTVAGTSGCR